ncbi:MAG: D-sedoheptulose 7-phosphate isomerase [Bacteroidia bacterium]|jgi:D-sedoheptulose 7-phosphate isomerase|nr:D-sedoheptulose 7-phosphate isomerase [Bacteroidia bacterium]
MKTTLLKAFEESVSTKQKIIQDNVLLEKIELLTNKIIQCYQNNGKVLWCGNGGSAADAQHLAAELSGRFYYDRQPLYSEALHVNTSYITAVANDYSYDEIFARLVKAMIQPQDILIGLSTSGNSKNVINALIEAKNKGAYTVGFTGETGGKMKDYVDLLINVPSKDTPRIQEAHMMIGHTVCQLVEQILFPKNEK